MKKAAILVLMAALLIVSGCGWFGKKEATPTPKPQTGQNDSKDQGKEPEKKYFIGFDTPAKGVAEWVERYQTYEGVFLQKVGNYRVMLVGMGELFSSGYSVDVVKIEETADKWMVHASFKRPPEEDYSGQSTYPFEVITFVDDKKPIEVLRVAEQEETVPLDIIEIPEGKKLPTSKNFVVFTPLEGEKISSPVRIKGKARVFEATFRISVEDGHNRLADKPMMSDEGAPGWGDFEVSLPFNKPTNPNGAVIFSYENMENGNIIEELLVPVKF